MPAKKGKRLRSGLLEGLGLFRQSEEQGLHRSTACFCVLGVVNRRARGSNLAGGGRAFALRC